MTSPKADSVTRCTGIVHVIYYVSSMQPAVAFYRDLLGFEIVDSLGDAGLFLRLPGSPNHFDLGLVEVGAEAVVDQEPTKRSGVYHVGWRLETLEDLAALHNEFVDRDLLIGTSDHGTHVSLYAVDPDNNEIEVCWVRRANERRSEGLVVTPLDLAEEIKRHRLEGSTQRKARARDEDS
jgi:catechol-2,3-dioxygenase